MASWTWFLDRGRVVERDENNMPVRMTGTHQNITLQKMQEQALAAVQQQLHDAVDMNAISCRP
jgi:PAS domain-containing protein